VKREVKKEMQGKRKSTRKQGRGKKLTPARMARLSPSGKMFLQCSIASRDFPGVKAGVPDATVGGTVTLRHRATYTVKGPQSGEWTGLFMPTPGVAYWSADQAASTGTVFEPFKFPDFDKMYGTGDDAGVLSNVDSFRYVGKTVEIKPISAVLNNAGMISAARVPAIQTTSVINGVYPTAPKLALAGVSSCTPQALSSMTSFYNGHINQGVFGFAVNGKTTFEWTSLQVDSDGTNIPYAEDTNKTCLNISDTQPEWNGFGNMQPVVITVSGTTQSTAWALTVEDVIEYRTVPGSLLSEAAAPKMSLRDQMALDLYEVAAEQLTPFVRADDNEGFWDRFLEIAAAVLSAAAPFAGTYSPIVGALGGIATGIRAMTL